MTLQSLKKKIRKYYYNEVGEQAAEMIEGQYSRDEMNELQQFMLNHPYVKFADELCKKAHVVLYGIDGISLLFPS